MTAQAQTLYLCDRCPTQVHADAQNAVAIVPEGWLAMMTGDDKAALSSTGRVRHLCPACRSAFATFMTHNTA